MERARMLGLCALNVTASMGKGVAGPEDISSAADGQKWLSHGEDLNSIA